MYDEILFPTDGSEASRATFSHAVALAQAFDARLHALFVVNTTYAGVGAAGSVNINSLRTSGEEVLDEFETRSPTKVSKRSQRSAKAIPTPRSSTTATRST